jgi:hypothetical protein
MVETAIWTGREMVIANTDQPSPSLSAYDPTLDQWREIPVPDPVALRRGSPYLGAVAGKVLLYGGLDLSSASSLTDGWTIDLTTGSWAPIPAGPPLSIPDDHLQHVFAAGTRALILPVADAHTLAATYDLVSGRWDSVPRTEATPGGDCFFSAGWNGGIALCGGWRGYLFVVTPQPLSATPFPKLLDKGGFYLLFTAYQDRFFTWAYPGFNVSDTEYRAFWIDRKRREWGATPAVPRRRDPVLATVAAGILVWGGDPNDYGSARNDGALLDPVAGTWSRVSCVGAPDPNRVSGTVLPTETGLIVFRGPGAANAVLEF